MDIEMLSVAALRPYARNARRHPPEQIDRLVESMRRFGWVTPMLVDAGGEIIAGHGRLLAAQRLWQSGADLQNCPRDTVPALRVENLTPAQVRAYRIADNKIASMSSFDDDLLSGILRELTEGGFPASALGFNDDELALLIGDTTGLTSEPLESTTTGNNAGDAEGVLPSAAPPDPYGFITFSVLVRPEQKADVLARLERARARYGVGSVGEALVAACRNFAVQ
jgi:hypothetical protein